MKIATIEELAYIIKQAKKNNQPQPIFFLGAGASKTGNIPLASDIVKDILNKYSDNPKISVLKDENKTYLKLMECLQPYERDMLLKDYIDKAKINVTHIYLAQLLMNEYADYILTVNFDNLMLRALALFNEFPATYDMAILKDLTTTTFKDKSVVYLHGQHHGLWLLNTKEEMDKVKATVPHIFDSIKNKRPWIFIGYSGDDPIFEHIQNLGRFDNGLYWIAYKENDPNEKVQDFLRAPNRNAFVIKGFDSDSFMLKLNNELELEQPNIVNSPFTSIKEMLDNIVDIDDDEHFKGVKERLEISKRQVDEAIKQFEKGEVKTSKIIKETSEIDLLKKDIIALIINEKYQKDIIEYIEDKVNRLNNKEVDSLLAGLYSDWGIHFGDLANTKGGKEAEELYNQAFEKYQRAINLNPNFDEAYFNWGIYLVDFAKTKEGKEVEILYNQAFEKFQKAIDIKPYKQEAYYNWGYYLGDLAETKEGKEAEELYNQAFEKFKRAIDIKPDKQEAYNNWGNYLGNLAETKEGKEAEELYNQAFEKFQKAIDIKPDKQEAYYNWGSSLGNLAKTKEGKEAEELYNQAFEKFQKTIDIKPDKQEAYYNWGSSLGNLAKTKEGKEAEELYNQAFEKFQKAIDIKPDNLEAYTNWGIFLVILSKNKVGKEAEELYNQAFEKFQKAFEFGGKYYNLACFYAFKKEDDKALHYLEESIKRNEITIAFVKDDVDWKDYLEDKKFNEIMDKYNK